MRLEITHTGDSTTDVDDPGSSWITDVELEIGGQKIDKHSGLWMETWFELTEPNPSGVVLVTNNLITQGSFFQRISNRVPAA